LSLVMAAMISALMIACLYSVYAALLSSGVSIVAAAMITGGVSILVILGLAGGIYALVQSLRHMPKKLFGHSQMSEQAMDVVDAFINGVMHDEPKQGTTSH